MDRDLITQIQQATSQRLSHEERAYAFSHLANWLHKTREGYARHSVLYPHIKPTIVKLCAHADVKYEDYVRRRETGQMMAFPDDSPLHSLAQLSEPAAAMAASLLMMIKVMNEDAPPGVKGMIAMEEHRAEMTFYYREARKYFVETLEKLDMDAQDAERAARAWERDMQKAIAYDYSLILPPH